MAKFVFKLQPLLNLKIQMENSIKNKLGEAIQKLEEGRSVLNEIEEQKNRCISRFGSRIKGKFLPRELQEYSTYISYLTDRTEQQKEKLKSLERNVDKITEELLQAVKERKMLDKLREKKHDSFVKEQLKKEQLLLEEITNYKHSSRENKNIFQ